MSGRNGENSVSPEGGEGETQVKIFRGCWMWKIEFIRSIYESYFGFLTYPTISCPRIQRIDNMR